jgi:N-acetylglutamate synthase-like GNAT family acetyltransferase
MATDQDLAEIRELLESAGLPTSDLVAAKPRFTVVREDGELVAAGALQAFGSSALLRSVVVADERRGTGLGSLVVRELEHVARSVHIERLILLTETAREFFARQGYCVIERSDAPQDVQGSDEFRALCPASATCMLKVLTNSD